MENKKEAEAQEKISLLLSTVKTTEQRGPFFDIVTTNGVLHFQAKSKTEMLNWINHIRSAIEHVYNILPAVESLKSSSHLPISSSPSLSSISSIDTSQSQSSLLDSSSSTTLSEVDRLKELLLLPGNNKCADCDAPGLSFFLILIIIIIIIIIIIFLFLKIMLIIIIMNDKDELTNEMQIRSGHQ